MEQNDDSAGKLAQNQTSGTAWPVSGHAGRWPIIRHFLVTLVASAVLVFTIELLFRGELAGTVGFFLQPFKPGWTTVILFTLTQP